MSPHLWCYQEHILFCTFCLREPLEWLFPFQKSKCRLELSRGLRPCWILGLGLGPGFDSLGTLLSCLPPHPGAGAGAER
jgi:hypothetical protein